MKSIVGMRKERDGALSRPKEKKSIRPGGNQSIIVLPGSGIWPLRETSLSAKVTRVAEFTISKKHG